MYIYMYLQMMNNPARGKAYMYTVHANDCTSLEQLSGSLKSYTIIFIDVGLYLKQLLSDRAQGLHCPSKKNTKFHHFHADLCHYKGSTFSVIQRP